MHTLIKRWPSQPALLHDPEALESALDLIIALPQDVRDDMLIPSRACSASEPSLSANRLRGFDAAGELCLYQHEFKLAEIDFDFDETPYVRVSLHETITAVRTRAGHWLCRVQRTEPEAASNSQHSDSGFRVTLADDLPPELAAQLRPILLKRPA